MFNISEKFTSVYEDRYNETKGSALTADLAEKLKTVSKDTESSQVSTVNMIIAKTLMKCASTFKPDKTDSTGGFSSETLLHSPEQFY